MSNYDNDNDVSGNDLTLFRWLAYNSPQRSYGGDRDNDSYDRTGNSSSNTNTFGSGRDQDDNSYGVSSLFMKDSTLLTACSPPTEQTTMETMMTALV